MTTTTEEWKPVKGREGRYEVSNCGRVRSLKAWVPNRGGWHTRKTPKLLSMKPGPQGYVRVSLSGKSTRVHNLVLEAFSGPRPSGMQAAHQNGHRADNDILNLKWMTPAANNHQKFQHGTMAIGEKAGPSKLTEKEVFEIRERLERGEKPYRLKDEYRVVIMTICHIRDGTRWKHILKGPIRPPKTPLGDLRAAIAGERPAFVAAPQHPNFMNHHPEQQDDEIYMGNATAESVAQSSWRTSRLGDQALDSNGAPIFTGDLQPWFIKTSEVEQAIEHERFMDKPWSEDRIRALQPMVDQRSAFTVNA